MKTFFVPINSKLGNFSQESLNEFNKLPKKIALFYSSQFKKLAEEIHLELKKEKEILLFSQVLGCSSPKIPKETQAAVLIGEGAFHATALEYELKIPTYIYQFGKLSRVNESDVTKLSEKEKAALMNYLNSEEIGILISTKPGQERLSKAIDFKKNLENKKSYLFISNDLNISEFDNFGLNSFVNTACPRMDMASSKIINLNKLDFKK